ncbi:MAG: DUF3078 domain-containing protein [Bacteroidota bacterium]|nr:DUF3078 domain-containing protein [Bacteroidota bacterium]
MSRKQFFFFLLVFAMCGNAALAVPSHGETGDKDSTIIDYWNLSGAGSMNINQGYLSNWVEGGESSINASWLMKLKADYERGKATWNNDATWKYGVLKAGDNAFRKNEDKFDFSSKYGYNASRKWYYSGLLTVKSQLFKGYDYPIDSVTVSAFLSPGNVVSSIGMDYKPNNGFSIMLSPFSVKTTVVWDTVNVDQTRYGLEENQRFKGEFGGYVTVTWEANLHENIVMNNKVELFSSYLYKPQNVDVDWEMSIVFKATEFISTTFSTHLIYDDDIEIPVYKSVNGEIVQDGVTRAIQFKEILSIGFSYKF